MAYFGVMILFIVMLWIAFVLAACTPSKSAGVGAEETGRTGRPATKAADIVGSSTAPEGMQRLFHFAFDSDEILAAEASELDRWARWLIANPKSDVRLEGHADERGTQDYNVSLGERRALTVMRELMSRGVAEKQMEVVSFGEGKPVDGGSTEGAWARNRRVEVVN